MHICSNCGHAEHLFGIGGGEKLAQNYGVKVLASLPLTMSIREQADSGKPTVVANPDSPEAAIYQQLARRVSAQLLKQLTPNMPSISISED